jgi:8-oxo-dGTP pyrophosphatase MutT (NUDIX family)
MLTGRHAPRTLLIKRAERTGDPWSGQVAFPGGKFQEGDTSARDTAVRETLEEVGIDLATSSEFLGYFRSFRTHTGNMDVVPALFLLKGDVRVRTNEEVTSFLWVGLERLTSDRARATYSLRLGGESREVPAFRVGGYVVWGLTQRIISALLEQPLGMS